MAIAFHAPVDAKVKFTTVGKAPDLVAIDCSCGEYAGQLVETRDLAMALWERHVEAAETGATDLNILQVRA